MLDEGIYFMLVMEHIGTNKVKKKVYKEFVWAGLKMEADKSSETLITTNQCTRLHIQISLNSYKLTVFENKVLKVRKREKKKMEEIT